jgi:hypothetical protein
MRVVILAGNFYPEIHPRSFRATELAREFVRQGHDVTVVCCRNIEGFDYKAFEKSENINIQRIDVYKGDKIAEVTAQKRTWLFKLKRFIIGYFFSGNLFRYGAEISQKLADLGCMKEADMVISMSTPFSDHYGLAKYIKNHGKNFVAIADSGDPFYYSKQSNRAIWFKYIEKWVYTCFDYLTIPTENAIPLYAPLTNRNKIRIIPQGFNMRNLKLYEGKRENPIKFAYAGVFYWDIRNPEFLFSYLNDLDLEYRFYIFMRYNDKTFDEILNKYPNLKEKVVVRLSVPHDELIYELSTMHFLINVENISNTQMPSKLIDYGMTGRPIFSCNSNSFIKEQLQNFINGDYSSRYQVDVKKYDIERIVNQFKELAREINP